MGLLSLEFGQYGSHVLMFANSWAISFRLLLHPIMNLGNSIFTWLGFSVMASGNTLHGVLSSMALRVKYPQPNNVPFLSFAIRTCSQVYAQLLSEDRSNLSTEIQRSPDFGSSERRSSLPFRFAFPARLLSDSLLPRKSSGLTSGCSCDTRPLTLLTHRRELFQSSTNENVGQGGN